MEIDLCFLMPVYYYFLGGVFLTFLEYRQTVTKFSFLIIVATGFVSLFHVVIYLKF